MQQCYINKWIKGHLSAKSVKILAIGQISNLSSVAPHGRKNQLLSCVRYRSIMLGKPILLSFLWLKIQNRPVKYVAV